jgi:lipopolysaccharide export LptBFGC system permease protein LptF
MNVSFFLENTKIQTIDSNNNIIEKPIQELQIGDKIRVYNFDNKKIKYLLKIKYENKNNKSSVYQMYKIKNENKFNRELFLTGGHSILVDELTDDQKKKTNQLKKIQEKYLLLTFINENAIQVDVSDRKYVYHIVLENQDKNQQFGIYANG